MIFGEGATEELSSLQRGDREYLRPTVHPSRPATGYVNDPNGPVLRGGVQHLYFQYVEDTPRRGAVRWGHITSTDLVTWDLHEPAVLPGSLPEDADGAWSGNVVVDSDGRLHAFYSGYRTQHPFQSVIHAVSDDGGFTFEDARAVGIDPEPEEGVAQFRDPFVWREKDGWRMLVGAEQHGRGAALLFSSVDLVDWVACGDLAHAEDDAQMWECPQYLQGEGDHAAVLFALWQQGEGIATLALLGRREGERLVDTHLQVVDHGTAFYAPSIQPVAAGAVLWGWVRETRDVDWAIADDWSGHLSLPRRASIENDTLILRPAAELDLLRSSTVTSGGVLARNETWSVGIGHAAEIDVQLVDDVRVDLRCAHGTFLRLDVSPVGGAIAVSRDGGGNDQRAERTPIRFMSETPLSRLRVYLDGSCVELFTDSGQSATFRVYPTSPDGWSVALTPVGEQTAVEVHQLSLPRVTGTK